MDQIITKQILMSDLKELSLLHEELSDTKTDYQKMVDNYIRMQANPDY